MKSSIKQMLAVTAVGLLGASVTFAAPIAPTGTHNQTLPDYSFGGGTTLGEPNIPTDRVTINASGPAGLTLGLSAHTRNVTPGLELADGGPGIFLANAGLSPYSSFAATWNFNFFIENTGAGGLSAYTYKISYGTDGSGLRSFDPLLYTDNVGALGIAAGNSQNPSFDYGSPFPTGVVGPAIEFDPLEDNVTYAFQLEAFNQAGDSVAKSAINVQVGNGGPGHTVPDAGSTLALMGVAFAGIAGLRRKFLA